MNSEPRPSLNIDFFLKALQVEIGTKNVPSEDDVIAMANDIEIENDSEFRSYVNEQIRDGYSARTIFENSEIAEEFNRLLNESTEEFCEHTLAMNAELKDLFEPDDDDETQSDR